MAFTSTVSGTPIVVGNRKHTEGTYTNTAGSTGGNIDTGLGVCESITLQPNASAVATNETVVNATLPTAGSSIAIVTDANQAGYWRAKGY